MVRLSSMMVAVTAMVLGISALDDKSANKLKDELKAAKIIPDAFENLTPLTEMKIIYNGKEVKNGDKIKPSEAVNRPGIQFTAPDKKKHYTIVMEDLDTPAPHVRHWIAANIKGADAENVVKDPSKMQDYVPYKGPTPPGKDVHRYVFALYEQSKENQKMTPELEDPTNHRAFFDVNKFAKENKLKLVAATYINSEHQEGYESNYSKTDKRSLARRAVAKKKGYTPNDRLVLRDGFDGSNIQNMSPREQVVNGGDGYVPSSGINGQYGGTWDGGQSFNSGYGQPSNGGQGGYDSGAGAIVAGNGPSGNGGGGGGGSGTVNGGTGNGGLVVFNPGNGSTVGNGGGSGTTGNSGVVVVGGGGSGTANGGTGNGGLVVFNPGNGGTVGNGGGSGTTGNSGVVVVGEGGTPKPTPIATPGATTFYYTYFYTISDVDYKPGQTYRGSDGQLYHIPSPSATPDPNLHRRDEVEEEEKDEEASMSVVEFDEGSGLNEDDVKFYNGMWVVRPDSTRKIFSQ